MKTIYPNENVKLTRGGRNSDKITVLEFENLIKSTYSKLKKKTEEVEEWDWDDPSWIFYLSDEYLPKFRKDLKYEFDFENIVIQPANSGLSLLESIKTTIGGTPYLELYCGGDWEKGLIVYLYPSEKSIRAYIPTKGNTVRKDLKCVFGSELELIFTNDGTISPESDKEFIDYLKKYSSEEILDGEEIDTEVNRDWCLEDFETRLGER